MLQLVSAAFLPNRRQAGLLRETPPVGHCLTAATERIPPAPELTHFRVIHPIRDGVLRYSPGRLTRI